MIVVITLLHIVTTIDFSLNVSFIHSMFVDNAQNILTEYLFSFESGLILLVGTGSTSAICSVLVDATMVCVTLLEFSLQLIIICRFGVAGSYGDGIGYLFCYLFFFSFVQ